MPLLGSDAGDNRLKLHNGFQRWFKTLLERGRVCHRSSGERFQDFI
jgi:hypothetical protein